MDAVFSIIREQQIWLYILFGVILAYLLRKVLQNILEHRRAIYGLEREKTLHRLTVTAILFALIIMFLGVTILIGSFTEPAEEVIPTATPAPTLSFLAMPDDITSTGEPGEDAAGDDILLVGCEPETAAIVSPEDGAVLRGVVEITGSANIQNFAFYKYEYKPAGQGTLWRAIFAGTEPVVEGSLGIWDTRLVQPGDYLFRLIVTDTMGNAPYPCVIQVQIESVEDE